MRCGEFLAALLEESLPIGGDQLFHGFDQQRQRRFAVCGDGQVDFRKLQVVRVVASREEIVGRDADLLRAGPIGSHAGKIDHFDAEDHVGIL